MSGTGIVGVDGAGYDVVAHAETLLQDGESLELLPGYLDYVHSYKVSLDEEIVQRTDKYNEYLASGDRFQVSEAREKLGELLSGIGANKELSKKTQDVITNMTSSIQKLDEGKKNLVMTMTVLRRLQMLTTAFEQLEVYSREKHYSESVQLLSAVLELLDHFKTYKSIDEIAVLTRDINKFKIMLTEQIFQDFEMVFSRQEFLKDVELRSACLILETAGQSYKERLVTWFTNNQLKEIKTIFASSDEAGSLENISRRFIFFKKVLKNYEQHFDSYFPKEWGMEKILTEKFCEITKESIKQVLSQTGKNTNVDLMLESLQQTLDFEKFINDKFKVKQIGAATASTSSLENSDPSFSEEDKQQQQHPFDITISTAFQPFLGIWVEHQNSFLSGLFMKFLSEPKLPNNIEDNTNNVIPSSADLFRAYRHLLTQCSALSKGAPLRDLSKLFGKWLMEYSNKILKPTLPTSVTNEESIEYVVLVLNTADYCSTTITQLEEKLVNIIDEQFKSKINFEKVKESFVNLINKSINLLLNKIEIENEFSWREMLNTNWSQLEDVGDQSRYAISIGNILKTNCSVILPKFSREIYIRNLCDKIVESTISDYLNNLVKLKPIKVIAAEQMLLDLSILKEILISLPKYAKLNEEKYSKLSSKYSKNCDKIINKLEVVLKVLLTQDAPQEGLVSNYFYLIGDKSESNFIKILKLKGIVEKSRQDKFLELFKIHKKQHDDLQDESAVLSKLDVDLPVNSVPNINNLLSNNSINSPKLGGTGTGVGNATANNNNHSIMGSPTLNKASEISSPKFENIFNAARRDNIEKGLKDLTINSEAGVNSIKNSFGRFFKSHNHTGSHDGTNDNLG